MVAVHSSQQEAKRERKWSLALFGVIPFGIESSSGHSAKVSGLLLMKTGRWGTKDQATLTAPMDRKGLKDTHSTFSMLKIVENDQWVPAALHFKTLALFLPLPISCSPEGRLSFGFPSLPVSCSPVGCPSFRFLALHFPFHGVYQGSEWSQNADFHLCIYVQRCPKMRKKACLRRIYSRVKIKVLRV